MALPLCGAGVLGYSQSLAARITIEAAHEFLVSRLASGEGAPGNIIFVEPADTAFFADELRQRFELPAGAHADETLPAAWKEIGRASCRERV